MKRIKIIAAMLILVIVFGLFAGCSTKGSEGNTENLPVEAGSNPIKEEKKQSDYSKSETRLARDQWEGNVFSNDYIGLSLTIPDNWTVMSDEELAETMGVTYDLISEGLDKKTADIVEGALIPLMMAYQGDDIYYSSSNINAGAERRLIKPNMELSIIEVQKMTKEVFLDIGEVYFSDIEMVTMNGIDVYFTTNEMDLYDGQIQQYQNMYMYYKNGYVVSVVVTTDDKSNPDIQGIIESINIE